MMRFAQRLLLGLALGFAAAPLLAQCPHEWDGAFRGTGLDGPPSNSTNWRSAVSIPGINGPRVFLGFGANCCGTHISGVGIVEDGTVVSAPNIVPVTASHGVSRLVTFDDGSGPHVYTWTSAGVFRFDETQWTPIGGGLGALMRLRVATDAQGPALYALGTVGTANPTGIMKLTAGTWTSVGTAPSVTATSGSVRVDDIAFMTVNGAPELHAILRWTATVNVNQVRIDRWSNGAWIPVVPQTASADADRKVLCVYDNGAGPKLYAGDYGTTGLRVVDNGALVNVPGFGGAFGVGGWVIDLAVFDGGTGPRLVACGSSIHVFSGTSAAPIAAFDGTSWSPVGPAAGDPFPTGGSYVAHLDPVVEGGVPVLYVGGSFLRGSDNVPYNGIARLSQSMWSAIGGAPLDGSVNAIAAFDGGDGTAIYAGGNFTYANGVVARRLAKWNGSTWSSLGAFTNAVSSQTVVNALKTFDDGSGPALYVAGSFTAIGGVSSASIGRWNGQAFSGLGAGLTKSGGAPSTVYALLVFDDGTGPALYAGGDFDLAGGVSAPNLAKWNGTAWSAVSGASLNGLVRALAAGTVNGVSRLFAGGDFTQVGTMNAVGIAAFDGFQWSTIGTGATWQGTPGRVFSLVTHDDGTGRALYLGGDFTHLNGTAAQNIARWDGLSATNLGSGAGPLGTLRYVNALAVYDDGQGPALYATGGTTTFGGVSANSIARWRAGQWSALGQGLHASLTNGNVSAAIGNALLGVDHPAFRGLWVGGFMTVAGTAGSSGIGFWRPNGDPFLCATLVEPAARGRVGEALGEPEAVVRVNGSSGGSAHRVNVPLASPITLSVANPAVTPYAAAFALFGYAGLPTAADVTTLPLGLGDASFPFAPLDPGNPGLVTIIDGLGIPGPLPLTAPALAPWTMSSPGGLPFPYAFAVQGLISDPTATFGFSLTNAVLIVVGP